MYTVWELRVWEHVEDTRIEKSHRLPLEVCLPSLPNQFSALFHCDSLYTLKIFLELKICYTLSTLFPFHLTRIKLSPIIQLWNHSFLTSGFAGKLLGCQLPTCLDVWDYWSWIISHCMFSLITVLDSPETAIFLLIARDFRYHFCLIGWISSQHLQLFLYPKHMLHSNYWI